MSEHMLTTIDNPFNPFVQFDDWYRFDEQKGYHTCSYLGRITGVSDALTDEMNENEIENAIDEIIKYDPFGLYIKVSKEDRIIPIAIDADEGV